VNVKAADARDRALTSVTLVHYYMHSPYSLGNAFIVRSVAGNTLIDVTSRI